MPSSSERGSARLQQIGGAYFRTALFCTAIAVTIWLLKLAEPLWAAFFVSFAIGFSITTASLVLHPPLLRWLPPIVASIITTGVGIGVGLLIGGYGLYGDLLLFVRHESYGTPLLALFFGVLGILFFGTRERLQEAETALANARAEQLAQEKTHLETQLRLLQAQIEPHFLFNTLSNVVGMIRAQPEAAEKMLLDLTTLLRANLKRTRTEKTTLGDELAVVSALLEINQIRMGERLSWSVDVPESLAALELPPMLLQPLVENAVKHGIEPLEEGGSIHIGGAMLNGSLAITIADTGQGLQEHLEPGSGSIGISNVQGRLRALFGGDAALSLAENVPRGLVATLTIPVSDA